MNVGELINQLNVQSTAGVTGLSRQIIGEVNLLVPGLLVDFDDLPVDGDPATVNFVLQAPARADLRRAIAARNNTRLHLNSAYRTVAQQHILFQLKARKGIGGRVAKPGTSPHENGFGIDTSDFQAWKNAMESHHWDHFGPGDLVHFTYIGGGVRTDLDELGVKAFQRLWNRHHPEDRIDDGGAYGPETAARLDRSPAGGFPAARVLRLTEPPLTGPDVRKVQEKLKSLTLLTDAQVTGNFDAETEAAVRAFQESKDILVDGKVGPQTFRLLGLAV